MNTSVLILNDGLDTLEKHPEEFVRKLAEAIQRGDTGDVVHSIGVGNHANPVQVLPPIHSSQTVLDVVGGNMTMRLDRVTLENCHAKGDHSMKTFKLFLQKARQIVEEMEKEVVRVERSGPPSPSRRQFPF